MKKDSYSYTFWKWMFKLSRKSLKKAHLSVWHTDIKCPHCLEWFSISGIDCVHEHAKETDLFFRVKCCRCGAFSNWSPNIAPFLVLVDDAGKLRQLYLIFILFLGINTIELT